MEQSFDRSKLSGSGTARFGVVVIDANVGGLDDAVLSQSDVVILRVFGRLSSPAASAKGNAAALARFRVAFVRVWPVGSVVFPGRAEFVAFAHRRVEETGLEIVEEAFQ